MAPTDRNNPRRAASSESRYSLMEFMREFPDGRVHQRQVRWEGEVGAGRVGPGRVTEPEPTDPLVPDRFQPQTSPLRPTAPHRVVGRLSRWRRHAQKPAPEGAGLASCLPKKIRWVVLIVVGVSQPSSNTEPVAVTLPFTRNINPPASSATPALHRNPAD